MAYMILLRSSNCTYRPHGSTLVEFVKGQCEKFKVFHDYHRQHVPQQQTVETTNKENKQQGGRN